MTLYHSTVYSEESTDQESNNWTLSIKLAKISISIIFAEDILFKMSMGVPMHVVQVVGWI